MKPKSLQPRRRRRPRRRQKGRRPPSPPPARRRRGRDRRRDRAARGRAACLRHVPHRDESASSATARCWWPRRAVERCRRALRCVVPVCPGQVSCVDPAVVAMRAIVAEAATADPELVGGRNGRRGKPQVTPYTQRTTEVYLTHRLGLVPREERSARARGPLAARARRTSHARPRRSVHGHQRDAARGLSEGDARGARLRAPVRREAPARARDTERQILEALADDLRFGPGVWREALRAERSPLRGRHPARTRATCGRATREDGARVARGAARLAGGWIWTDNRPARRRSPTSPARVATADG